jgi:digeranylgeranylglycerophospholipid reductase
MAKDAVRAGAETKLKTSVTGLILEDGKVKGVKAKHMGKSFEIHADVVVGADGFESQVGRWAGIDTSLEPKDISTCFQYRMTNIDCDSDYCEFIIGDLSIGGYIWMFPKDDDTANIGVGLLLNKIKGKGEVKAYLDNYIKKHPEYAKGKVIEMVAGAVSTCAPIDKTIGEGIILVGDAARQIDPMTGGGVANGCIAGKVAGEVVAEAVKEGDFSEEFLKRYENGWRDKLESSLYRNWIAKDKLISLGNENINKIVRTLAEVGVEKLAILDILRILTDKHPELVEELQGLV